MITLNLLPDIKRQYLNSRRTQARVIGIAIFVCIAAVAAVVLTGMWVYGVQNLQKSSLTKSIDTKQTELKNIKDIQKYVTIQSQLANISGLHEKKAILSRVFDVVSKLNPKSPNNVRVSALNIDTDTFIMTFDAKTDSYTGLETFRDTLKNASLNYRTLTDDTVVTEPLFTGVTIISQGIGQEASDGAVVGFKISVTYNQNLFATGSRDIGITVPNKETTQSKQDTPDLFGETNREETP